MRHVLLILLFLQGSCILDWIAAGQLCVLRTSNLNHPHTLQRSWSPHCCHSSANAAPVLSHLKPLPRFTDCFWELRRQPRLPLVQNTLGHFWRHFLGTAEFFQNFGQIVKNKFFWTRSGKIGRFCIFGGCGLPSSAAILRHLGFVSKSPCLASKTLKNADLAENLT